MNSSLTHFDAAGQAHMVDVGDKTETRRIARAVGSISMQMDTLALTRVAVEFSIDEAQQKIGCEVTAESFGRTGVEMEALTALSVGLLTIYDMCKAADRGMRIENIRLIEKSGGKSGHWHGA